MTVDSVQVERRLGATKIAALFGKKGGRRTVTAWAKMGCPCDVEEGGRGARRFNAVEVRDWLDAQDLRYRLSDEAQRLMPVSGRRTDTDGLDVNDGDAAPSDSNEAGSAIANAESSLRTLAEKINTVEDMTAAQAASFTRSLSALSTELRHLRAEELKRRERMGELVEVVDAEDAVALAIALIVSDVCALGSQLPRAILAAMVDGGLVIADQETAVRLITDAVVAATDKVRADRAAWMKETYGRSITEAA